ncbi:ABC transporter ATP-binding protein [Tomitella fengzijianii]|nr:ABC transporter ATP-binding protein [Tomitella fengzijianii]
MAHMKSRSTRNQTTALADAHAVELHDVSRIFGKRGTAVRALDGISVDFPRAQWTAVMGPSGSGKSTMLHCAAGLEGVSSGEVRVAGTDITEASSEALTALRRGTIGFVFQSFNLLSALTAEQNVSLPLRLGGQRVSTSDARRVLADVGLADRAKHRPRALSGGQQQRVAIARAMVTRPAVLFADEPTGALDSTSAKVVLDLLRDMVDRSGQSIIMVTHDPAAAARADSVLFLSDGRIVDRLYNATSAEVAGRLAAMEK